jgi:hypothetical protein
VIVSLLPNPIAGVAVVPARLAKIFPVIFALLLNETRFPLYIFPVTTRLFFIVIEWFVPIFPWTVAVLLKMMPCELLYGLVGALPPQMAKSDSFSCTGPL